MTPTAYILPFSRYRTHEGLIAASGLHHAEVVATQFDDLLKPVRWAIREGGSVLARDGEWEIEPQPSSRDAEFLERTRFGVGSGSVWKL